MEAGTFSHTCCFTVDMTEQERSERRVAAQHTVTRLLADGASFPDITDSILQTLCEASECEMGAAWQVDEPSQQLRCVKTWRRSASDFPEFEKLTRASRFDRSKGLPGRIWATCEPAWIPDLAVDGNLSRQLVALAEGMRSAFGFPISSGGSTWGVIEFFSVHTRQPDHEFMDMMAAIGSQIAQFIERKQVESARDKLAAIVDCSHDAIASKDLNGIVTSWNDSAERMFGYKADEIIGRSITLIIPPELQDEEPRILAKIRAGERIDHYETVRQKKNGERITISLTVSPIRDQRGNILGVAKIARDVTQQKKLEEALHITEKLASVGRLAATVAHEINNPLEAATNFVYLATLEPGLPENVQRCLESADKELRRVAHIAQQTLGFYRDNSRPTQLVVSNVIESVIAIYESRLRYKRLRVEKRLQADLEVYTSQGELKQILSNVIANAIDACGEGGRIVIAARASRDFHSGGQGIRITVADDGTGISAHDKQKVFAPFFTTKKQVGTGLGLWVVKDLLAKNEGSIRLRSNNGPKSGTVVTIFLPLLTSAPVRAA